MQSLLSLDGLLFVLRWLHFVFGITWIGLLYYFNFVQGAFFNEIDAQVKSVAIQKLVPRAMWWFRWGAAWTFFTGLIYLSIRGHQVGMDGLASSYWINILTGATLGTIMAANVWFIIWPAQKIIIQNATQTAKGGAAIPEAAARGVRSTVASRTNTLFSIPLLFFMGAASHLVYAVGSQSNILLYWVLALVTIGAIEANALFGKTGPMTTIKGVIHCGVALTVIFYVFIAITM
jgi:uncharacterized membrane protein